MADPNKMYVPTESDPARWNSEVDAESIATSFDDREELDADDIAYLDDLDKISDEA